jgi:microcin C transport system permease protein
MNPVNRRRIARFRANRRGVVSLVLFSALFLVSLFAEFLANDKPVLIYYDGAFYSPILRDYPETTFGGDLPTNAYYGDKEVQQMIERKGWMLWPLIPWRYDTRATGEQKTSLALLPPSLAHPLGTDDQARDVLARVIYGFRISVLFGLSLTILSSTVGIAAGAVQGYFGGWVDLSFQRFLEVWSSLPALFLLIILSSLVQPGFWILLGIMLLFSWTALVGYVRAEFLRGRNFDYVRAARALGMLDARIMMRHILPNAMTAALTYLPLILAGSVTTLTSLDFLGYGLPPGSPSLGELLLQGKNNLEAPWLAFTGFFVIALMLALLVFVGEAVRDALNPRQVRAEPRA